jgi:hypothetical protein
MAGESRPFPIEIDTRDNMYKGYLTVLESISGLTELPTKETFFKDIAKGKESFITLKGSASEASSSNRKLKAIAK